MRDLRAAAFHEAEAQRRKRVEHAAEHEIGERDGVFDWISHSAPEAVAARGKMARQPPPARNRAGVNGVNDNRHFELLGLSVERPELIDVDVFIVNRGVANGRVQTQIAHRPVKLLHRERGSLQWKRDQTEEFAGKFFNDTAQRIIVRAANAQRHCRIDVVVKRAIVGNEDLHIELRYRHVGHALRGIFPCNAWPRIERIWEVPRIIRNTPLPLFVDNSNASRVGNEHGPVGTKLGRHLIESIVRKDMRITIYIDHRIPDFGSSLCTPFRLRRISEGTAIAKETYLYATGSRMTLFTPWNSLSINPALSNSFTKLLS